MPCPSKVYMAADGTHFTWFYKLISLTYKVLNTSQPTYLHNFISLQTDNNTRYPPPLLWKSLIALFSTPRLISATNFLLHFVNKFHLSMLIWIHLSLLHFWSRLHTSLLHCFTLNSKLTFLTNLFHHGTLTIGTPDWLPQLIRSFSVSTLLIGFSSWFWCGRLN